MRYRAAPAFGDGGFQQCGYLVDGRIESPAKPVDAFLQRALAWQQRIDLRQDRVKLLDLAIRRLHAEQAQ